MTDALLVAGQNLDGGFAALPSPHAGGLVLWPHGLTLGDLGNAVPDSISEPSLLPASRELQGSGFSQRQRSQWPETVGDHSLREDQLRIDVHLRRARRAVEQLAKSQERALRVGQFQQETQWLAENANRYAGQWIALQGRQLLAVGATAKEVFLKVADQETPPLVILVDNDLPFAGW